MPSYAVHRCRARHVARVTLIIVFSVTWPIFGIHSAQVFATSAALAALIGGLIPDLDAQSSHPRRLVEQLLTVGLYLTLGACVALIWLTWLSLHASTSRTLLTAVGATVGVLIASRVLLRRLVLIVLDTVIPTHRGPLHDFRFWCAVVGGMLLLLGGLNWWYGSRAPIVIAIECGVTAIGFLLGVAVHLHDDDVLTPYKKY